MAPRWYRDQDDDRRNDRDWTRTRRGYQDDDRPYSGRANPRWREDDGFGSPGRGPRYPAPETPFQTGDFGSGGGPRVHSRPGGPPTHQDQIGRGVDQTFGYGYGGDRSSGERGLMTRAADEIASWFGDEEAARRREADHRGKGPKGYARSDARIYEDLCDKLSDDPQIDASEIEVQVQSGEVTLSGTVESKHSRRLAEDCADRVSGVRHVQNNLRVGVTPVFKSGSSTESATASATTADHRSTQNPSIMES